MAFLPLEVWSFAPGNSEEWHRRSPLKEEMPGMWEGKFFSPEWPVAWMMCFGWRVRVEVTPF